MQHLDFPSMPGKETAAAFLVRKFLPTPPSPLKMLIHQKQHFFQWKGLGFFKLFFFTL